MKKSVKKAKKASRVKSNLFPAELFELEALVGRFIEYWGFKKIHGRIWLHLYTSSVPLDTSELMSRLNVSKGLMSIAIRELLDYKVILPASVEKHGTIRYEANPNVEEAILSILKSREAALLATTKKTSLRFAQIANEKLNQHNISLSRVQNIHRMSAQAESLLHLFLAQQESGFLKN